MGVHDVGAISHVAQTISFVPCMTYHIRVYDIFLYSMHIRQSITRSSSPPAPGQRPPHLHAQHVGPVDHQDLYARQEVRLSRARRLATGGGGAALPSRSGAPPSLIGVLGQLGGEGNGRGDDDVGLEEVREQPAVRQVGWMRGGEGGFQRDPYHEPNPFPYHSLCHT